jgi:hypothetical protein
MAENGLLFRNLILIAGAQSLDDRFMLSQWKIETFPG